LLLQTMRASRAADVYLCGPDGFMRNCERAAKEAGIAADRIYSESFLADAGDIAGGPCISVIAELPGGSKVAVRSRIGGTLLPALLQSGAPQVGICAGQASCGTCRITIAGAWQDAFAPASRSERRLLDILPNPMPNHRLACQVRLTDAHSNLAFASAPIH
jgi:CDP-4-dehydro-6-deoxyglucose reductase, E3